VRPPFRPGDELELTIDTLAFGGRGIGRLDGVVVFVAGALPGDRVRARIVKVKRRHGEAVRVETLAFGPDHVTAPCPHFGHCGGCRWQDLAYARQLEHKQAQIGDALERIGGLSGFELAPIVPAVRELGYRNKLEYTWARSPDGPAPGFHAAGRWDEVLALETCLLAGPKGGPVREAFRDWARAQGLEAFAQTDGEGYLRHLVVREGIRTGEVLCILVTGPGDPPDFEALQQLLAERCPTVVGVLHAINDGNAESTAGLQAKVAFGQGWFEEEILGLRLRVSAGSFLQTNTEMTDLLYGEAVRRAALTGREVVWDLYSGIGSIALALAGGASRVIGVEIVEEAVERARENALLNGVGNAEFVAGDAAKTIRPLLEQGLPSPDVVVVDPPRAGLTPRAVRRVVELDPKRLVYVSCNPTTLAGNGKLFDEAGYKLVSVTPFDLFPHTPHVECVATFDRVGVAPSPAPAP
jgi:23S rRNA (uracil1939-C5)-methyltransferase